MKLSSLLNPDFILLNESVHSQEEAISKMLDKIYKSYAFEMDKEQVIEAIGEREKQGHTIFTAGIAIPHIRLQNFDDFIISFCVPKEPFLLNGTNVKMVVLIIASHTSPNMHLNTLAAMAGLGENDPLLRKLLSKTTASDFIKEFEEADFRVKKELTISDIMSQNVLMAHPDTTVKEIVDIMTQHNIGYVPVVDKNSHPVGEVTVLEILKKGIPNYAMMLENLNFLSSLTAFEDLLKNETSIKAEEIMRDIKQTLSPDTPVVEAAFIMVQNSHRHLIVEKDGKTVGVVSYMDMLSKVLRG